MNSVVFVAWRSTNDSNPSWGPVARLDSVDGYFFLRYTKGAKSLEGFQAFYGMPDLEATYASNRLFPLFQNRLINPKRPDYSSLLHWAGATADASHDGLRLLWLTNGRRATDSLEAFVQPSPDAKGRYVQPFFLHGIEWVSTSAIDHIQSLTSGTPLTLMFDDFNVFDPHAVAVRTSGRGERFLLGYIPRYLARDIRKLAKTNSTRPMRVTAVQINREAPLNHRLLCRLECDWPLRFDPYADEEFQPIPKWPVSEIIKSLEAQT